MSDNEDKFFNFKHKPTPMLGRRVKRRRPVKTNKGWVIAESEEWEFLNTKSGIHHVLSQDQVDDLYDPADDEAKEALK